VIDIAMDTATGTAASPATPRIKMAPPVIIQIAIELKSIWTEHGKASWNRLRDLPSFHAYAHEYGPRTITTDRIILFAYGNRVAVL
jgi:hypothetical protein